MPLAASAAATVAGLLLAAGPGPDLVLTLRDPTLTESSGLARSARHARVLWTHNDGGPVAQVIAVDAGGDTVARVTLAGIHPYDPEALAPGPGAQGGPALYLGDIGDNLEERPDVSVFRFTEPRRLADATVPARWWRFTYPDGAHDAEALLVGPDGRIMVATKALSGAALYRAPRELVTEDRGTNRLTKVADIPSLVTDGAMLPDGGFVLRTYTSVYRYDRPGHEVARAALPPQPQGESVAVDGDRLLVGSEGTGSQVLAVPVPALDPDPDLPPMSQPPQPSQPAQPSPEQSATTTGTAADVGGGTRATAVATEVAWLVGAVVLLAGLAVVLSRRRTSRRTGPGGPTAR